MRALGTTIVVLVLATGSCKSANDRKVDADRQVYEIIKARRDELAAGDPFTIEPPEYTLRDRLLEGESLVEPLDLPKCLDIAAENSREYRSQREALYLTALDLTLEQWDFSVQTEGTFGAFLSGTGSEPQSSGFLADLGISKLFATGLAIVGNAGIDLVRDVSTGDGWDAVSNLSLNVTQPLLRGYGRDIVREPLTQAERDVLYEARRYERFRRTFSFDVASRFFLILLQEVTLENEIRNRESVTELRERNEAMSEAGRLNEIQVDQARQDELAAETRVIESRRRLESQLDDFKLFLGLPIEIDLAVHPGELLDLQRWEALNLGFTEDVVVEIALANRLDFLNELDRLEDANRRVKVAANDLRTGLDLVARGTAVSQTGDPFDYRGSDFKWNLSVNLDAPINLLPERNFYRSSLIAVQVAERRIDATADGIANDVRDQLRRLVAAAENLEIERGAAILAERRVESAALQLEAGRVSTRDVLEAQRALVDSQNAASTALTEYILAGISLYRDMELIRVTAEGIVIDSAPIVDALEEDTP